MSGAYLTRVDGNLLVRGCRHCNARLRDDLSCPKCGPRVVGEVPKNAGPFPDDATDKCGACGFHVCGCGRPELKRTAPPTPKADAGQYGWCRECQIYVGDDHPYPCPSVATLLEAAKALREPEVREGWEHAGQRGFMGRVLKAAVNTWRLAGTDYTVTEWDDGVIDVFRRGYACGHDGCKSVRAAMEAAEQLAAESREGWDALPQIRSYIFVGRGLQISFNGTEESGGWDVTCGLRFSQDALKALHGRRYPSAITAMLAAEKALA